MWPRFQFAQNFTILRVTLEDVAGIKYNPVVHKYGLAENDLYIKVWL